MQTELAKQLGIEFPIFAFTHCRDVVAAVSKAGGFGVLGAVGFTPEQLEVELAWIDEHVGDKPYGVDIVIPDKYEGMGELDPAKLEDDLRAMIPQGHLDFAGKLLADHGVPLADEGEENSLKLLGWTEATATPQVEIALRHPKMTLIANALGTPPKDIIDHIHAEGRKVAALCGSPYQARKHADAGVDIIIAQGGEGGGHCGEVGSIVLWPQVVKAVAPTPGARRGRHRQRPPDRRGACARRAGRVDRLAVAHGRGGREHAGTAADLHQGLVTRHRAVALVHRQAVPHAAQRLDRRVGGPGHAGPLGMPLQYMVSGIAVAATHRYPDQTVDVAFNPVGQVVGQFERVEKDVIYRWVERVHRVERTPQQTDDRLTR